MERRGFEPLTSAVQVAARLTGSFGSVIVVPTADTVFAGHGGDPGVGNAEG